MCWWTKTDATTYRVRSADTETVVQVVLRYPALTVKVWSVLLSVLAGPGLTRDDTDEDTLHLSLILPTILTAWPQVWLSFGTAEH